MTFLFPALLGGLLLAGIPVLLHLIMRQKPKRLPFPAFRFLARKAVANRRRMRLKHLWLLLLRILLIVCMCLALARPRIFSEALSLTDDRPVAAVIIVDTSMSMAYTVAGRTRLDDAKARALELIAALPAGSRFAVLDTAEVGGAWLPSATSARERVANLELNYAAGPMTEGVFAAYRLFAELAAENTDPEALPARFVYVITDRTPACWDATRTNDLAAASARLGDPKPDHVLIDVGLDKPADLALTELRLRPQVIPANLPINLPITVQATGKDVDTQVQCRIDGLPEVEAKPVQLAAGQSKEITFTRKNLKPGRYRAEVRLATDDSLLEDNILYVTFEVAEPRRVLVVCDLAEYATQFVLAVKARFPCEVKTTGDPWLRTVTPADLAPYRAIVLISVAAPGALWDKLGAYITDGGGVLVVPGGDEIQRGDYSPTGPAGAWLPGDLTEFVASGPEGAVWIDYQYQHPLMAPWREWAQNPESGLANRPPRAYRYWATKPNANAYVLVRFNDEKKNPAIMEANYDRAKVHGRLLMYTSPIDDRRDAADRNWNNYLWEETWYGLVLANQTLEYLGGADADVVLNFPAGRPVVVPLPAGSLAKSFIVNGPGVDNVIVPRPEKGNDLRLIQPQRLGHYTVHSADRAWSTGFSLNAAASEFQLLPRVPADTIAAAFGPDSIIAPGQTVSLKEKLDQRYRQPLEVFPWLMLFVLLALAVENYLANRFYRTSTPPDEAGTRDIIPT